MDLNLNKKRIQDKMRHLNKNQDFIYKNFGNG